MIIDLSGGTRDDALFIVVEGNIGAGKSEFCSMLARHRLLTTSKQHTIFPEPVHKEAFKKLLGLYYTDAQRWAFTMQMYALKERYRQHMMAAALVMGGVSVVQDRSIYADSCFGAVCHDGGTINEIEWEVYAETFGAMKQNMRYPDAMIYLRTDPAVCKSRMDRRKRPQEEGVQLEYLKQVHDAHEQLAIDMAKFIPVVTVDWDYFGDRIPDINQQVDEALKGRGRFVRDFRLI